MNIQMKILLVFLILHTLLLSKNLEKVSIQLQWLDQFQFAGYYVAKEKGFYKKAGLEVDILKYSNNIDVVKNVINKKATFGTGRTSLLIRKNNGENVVALAAIFQHAPDALLVTNKEILTPHNLLNKKIMITNDAINSASYMAMLFSEGINESDFIKQNHSFNIDDLITGKTQAIASYISNEPYLLEKRGIKYKYFHPKDYGFDFYGDILFTSKEELDNNPQRVESFVKASLKGWKYAFDNIEETAKLIFNKYNTQNKELDALIYEGYILKDLAYEENIEFGHISYDKFEDIGKSYRLLGVIKKDYSLDNFIYDFMCLEKDGIQFTHEEKNWLMNNKTIKVAVHKEWNPVEFYNDANIYSGINSSYLKLLEEKLSLKFEIVKNGFWHEKVEKINHNEVDILMSSVRTPIKARKLNFTTPYIEFPTVIVTKDDVNYIRDLKTLKNKIIAVEKGFYTHELLKLYNKDIKIIEVNTTKEALEKVYRGSAFAYIGPLPTISYFIKKLKFTNLKISGEAPFKTKISIAIRKDLPLLNSILEKTIFSITSKEHDDIYNKWVNVTYEYEVDYKILSIILLIVLLVLLLFFAWNRGLKKELTLKEQFSKELKYLNKTLEYKNDELKELAENDSLTQIANRRKLDTFLEAEIQRAKRNNLKLSVILLDVDFFKKVNDNYGHKMGDKVLVLLAQTLRKHIRVYDLVGRWGGEEFLIICPNTNLRQAYTLCKKLQDIIKKDTISLLKGKHITVSCGISEYHIQDTSDQIITKVDKEMYKAKNNGRDCISPQVSKPL